jgi:hypothetical protein
MNIFAKAGCTPTNADKNTQLRNAIAIIEEKRPNGTFDANLRGLVDGGEKRET